MFPAHPTQLYRKTDGSYVNRPFCVTHWRKQQERRKKAAPQLTFFCFLFFLERKGRPLFQQQFNGAVQGLDCLRIAALHRIHNAVIHVIL